MINTTKLRNCRGSAYVEYFVAAVAFAIAAMWFFDSGEYHGIKTRLQGGFDMQMQSIAGTERI